VSLSTMGDIAGLTGNMAPGAGHTHLEPLLLVEALVSAE
jgi:hypothetical protein